MPKQLGDDALLTRCFSDAAQPEGAEAHPHVSHRAVLVPLQPIVHPRRVACHVRAEVPVQRRAHAGSGAQVQHGVTRREDAIRQCARNVPLRRRLIWVRRRCVGQRAGCALDGREGHQRPGRRRLVFPELGNGDPDDGPELAAEANQE